MVKKLVVRDVLVTYYFIVTGIMGVARGETWPWPH